MNKLLLSLLIVICNSLATSSTLNTIQYNLHLFGGTIVPEKYRDEERASGVCKVAISLDFDLVSMVEVWANGYKDDMIECLKDTYPYHFFHDTPAYKLGDGLLFFSKYEIEDTRFDEFKDLTGWDEMSQKGVLSILINFMDTQIRVFQTHTQADVPHYTERYKNLKQIHDVSTEFHPGIPTIFLGDLNIGYSKNYTKEYSDLMELFDGYVDTLTDEDYTPTVDPLVNKMAGKFCEGDPIERDDMIMVTEDFKVKKHVIYYNETQFKLNDGWDLSDHYPIAAFLEL